MRVRIKNEKFYLCDFVIGDGGNVVIHRRGSGGGKWRR